MHTVQYMATYGVARVQRSSLHYQIYRLAAPRGLASIPVSTCLGFRVLLRSYSWYVYTDTLSTVLIQITVVTETHHCNTNMLRSLLRPQGQSSTRFATSSYLDNSIECRIYASRLDCARHTASIACSGTRCPLRESIYDGEGATMTPYQ